MRRLVPVGFGLLLLVVLFTFWGLRMSLKTVHEGANEIRWSHDDAVSQALEEISRTRVFFGHQSVGRNILDGIREIVNNAGGSLEISDQKEIQNSAVGVLYHSSIGRNTRPRSKIRGFKKIVTDSIGGNVEIAFMKFCYVDIDRDSNVEEIFDAYASEMEGLKDRFPQTVFVHVTVPIESMPRSAEGALKHAIKRIVGKPGVVEDNRTRQRFNELLRHHYAGREPVFDLAAWESLDSDGNSTVRVSNGERIQFMDSKKTNDGGHLNAAGRTALGRELLVFLAGIEKARR